MISTLRITLSFISVVLVLACLAGCGGSSNSSGGSTEATVARVAGTGLTKQTLDYWMRALFGEDFVDTTEQTVPQGLVSEPANNSRCAATLEAGMSASLKGRARPTSAQLFQKCQQLNNIVREQALAAMISWQRTLQIAAEKGIQATDAEVQQRLDYIRNQELPKPGEWQAYLNERGWSPAVELLRVKLNVLSAKIYQQVTEGKGEQALINFYKKQNVQWISKTTCEAGYVVQGCREFVKHGLVGAGADELIKAIANLKDGVAHLKGGKTVFEPAGSGR